MGLFMSGCSMAETITPKPPVEDYAKEVAATSSPVLAKALDGVVTRYLRGTYKIKSVQYYKFKSDVPWVAISKEVQNQMLEKSVKRSFFDWNEPGIDIIDIYPQGKTAFVIAMDKKALLSKKQFVGYYVVDGGK
jgi:hypothetical protein